MSVLIFSWDIDLHARAVAWALQTQNIPVQIFDISKFPSNKSMSIIPNAKWVDFRDDQENLNHLNLDTVSAIWCHRMVGQRYLDFSDIHPQDIEAVQQEASEFVRNFWHLIEIQTTNKKVSWINRLSASQRVKNKSLQLHVAAEIGFIVPDTLISNDPKKIIDFFNSHDGAVIIKPFFPKTWGEGEKEYHQHTFLVQRHHLVEESLRLSPAIYQKHIIKKYELRVMILGAEILAAKINSQAHAHSKIDWRFDANHGAMKFEPYELENNVKNQILNFMKRFDLEFGSMDFIVTPDNELVFLEINEQGQFLFIESQCNSIPVLSKVTSFLASEAGYEIKPDIDMSYHNYTKTDDYQNVMTAIRKR